MMSTDPRPLPATYASIVFKSENLDTDLVSAIMERQPTLSYRKGDNYIVNGNFRRRQFGLWIFSTRNLVHSPSLKKHLRVLEEIILGEKSGWPHKALEKIRCLVGEQSVEFRVDVFWYGAAGSELPEISLSFQAVVAAAGGTVESDFHRDGDETRAA